MAQKYFGFNNFSHSYTILMCNASIEINIKAADCKLLKENTEVRSITRFIKASAIA